MTTYRRTKAALLSIFFFSMSGALALAEALTAYSPQGGDRAVWIAEQAKLAGHEVDILTAGGGELYDRLLAERANPQADVVFGLVDSAMSTLNSEGLFQAYVPTWADGLADVYKSPDGVVHKFWQTPVVIAYNSDAMSASEAPKSWLDLTRPEYSGRYVIGPTRWQTTKTYLVGILARFLDENGDVTEDGWDFMQAFYDNAIVVDGNDAKAAEFVNGTAVIDLNWFGGAIRQANDIGYNFEMVDTEGGTPLIAEGISIMAGTDKLEQAKAFVDWFGSPEFMIAYAEQFGQVPSHPDAIAGSPETVQANATRVAPQQIDWDGVAPKIDGWMQRIELEIK